MSHPNPSKKRVTAHINTFFKTYWFAFVIFACCGTFQLLGWVEALQYNRHTVFHGEPWRFFTANFVHLGWPHFWMNMGALGLIWLMFAKRFNTFEWCGIFIISALIVSAGVHYHNPEFNYYVGLSGVLHGLIIAGVLRELAVDRIYAVAVGLLTLIKLGYEQLNGALPGSEATAGGTVLVDSHLFGAIGGAVAVLLLWTIKHTLGKNHALRHD